MAGQGGSSGRVRIQHVGLATPTSCRLVGATDFQDRNSRRNEGSGESGTIATGSFDADDVRNTVAGEEFDGRTIPGRSGGELLIGDGLTGHRDHRDMNSVGMGIGTADDPVRLGHLRCFLPFLVS